MTEAGVARPAVAGRGLVCQFGSVRAVDDLSFEVAEGEVFGLLGPNGAGGVDLGTLLGGVIVTEQVFGLPGLGQLAWQSVTTQDLPVIIGTVLVASAFIVVANLLVDLGYALLDPRVRPS